MTGSHILFAHTIWAQNLKKGSKVIDATSGNGNDLLYISNLCLNEKRGHIWAFDIQKKAIKKSKELLNTNVKKDLLNSITFIEASHENFSSYVFEKVDAIIYNLGYLPGSDKSTKTSLDSTLKSLENALKMLNDAGFISITLYPGHSGGEKEKEGVLNFCKELRRKEYSCLHTEWINQNNLSPSLIIIQKRNQTSCDKKVFAETIVGSSSRNL